jgi:hypothetical protein
MAICAAQWDKKDTVSETKKNKVFPVPDSNEEEAVFMKRCMDDKNMNEIFTEESERAFVCGCAWEEASQEAPEEPAPEEEPPAKPETPDSEKPEGEFKKKAADEEVPTGEQPPVKPPQNPDDASGRYMDFVISDENVDRDGDVVTLEGCDISAFEKNPVFLMWHDKQNFPVGKFVKVWVENGCRRGRVKFIPEGKFDQADLAYYMYKEGFMNAVSVGFRPIAPIEESVKQNDFGGFTYLKYELFEVSGVAVPANPRALAERKEYEKEFDGIIWKTYGLTPAKANEAKAKSEEAKLSKLNDMLKNLNSIYKEK